MWFDFDLQIKFNTTQNRGSEGLLLKPVWEQ